MMDVMIEDKWEELQSKLEVTLDAYGVAYVDRSWIVEFDLFELLTKLLSAGYQMRGKYSFVQGNQLLIGIEVRR